MIGSICRYASAIIFTNSAAIIGHGVQKDVCSARGRIIGGREGAQAPCPKAIVSRRRKLKRAASGPPQTQTCGVAYGVITPTQVYILRAPITKDRYIELAITIRPREEPRTFLSVTQCIIDKTGHQNIKKESAIEFYTLKWVLCNSFMWFLA